MPEWSNGPVGLPELEHLTAKQREVLELLLKHMTSKEIARELGISRHTVDQRIDVCKKKLGAATRGTLAQAYERLSGIPERLTYEDSSVGTATLLPVADAQVPEGNQPGNVPPVRIKASEQEQVFQGYRVGPQLLNGSQSSQFRLLTIIGIAALLVITFLGGISIFVEMSQILTQ